MNGSYSDRIGVSQVEEHVLDFAEELFTERGFESVSFEDIARGARVSRSLLYRRFGSRQKLFVWCVRRARADFEKSLREVTQAAATRDAAIAACGVCLFAVAIKSPARWALLFSSTAGL